MPFYTQPLVPGANSRGPLLCVPECQVALSLALLPEIALEKLNLPQGTLDIPQAQDMKAPMWSSGNQEASSEPPRETQETDM